MFLVDTDVVSALRRPERNPAPTRWLEAQQPSNVYLSVMTTGEIERGIARQRRQNPSFARDLAQWYEQPAHNLLEAGSTPARPTFR